ncbi:alkene reductase [Sphingomonas spermidinifaciens]|uniref:Alkene reductase n=1 Tax=Sphingomonas spermidinifaciens TaxID=1141889 RepID=A0A2A4AZE7_9SPHN|nr:alkene reductase [Sphingomonas spermidinifaciens]PCD02323.1 alkene reductase [Sphingomonas spermidinifaciens]
MASLYDPIRLGAVEAPNRILMSPLTRGRATEGHVPTPIMGDYYAQRAGAGLIISEATGISREGLGWAYAPGLWTDEQVEGWKPVVERVHQAGGRIFAQLWHMGRLVHPDFLGGAAPLSSSATTAPGSVRTYLSNGEKKPYGEARAATLDDIKRVLDDYEHATRGALAAGFDGVQLHAANGYLIDEFLRDNSNFRDDDYGGSPENRGRLLREAMDRIVEVAGADRAAVRFSPNGDTQGVIDSNPEAVFLPIADYLESKKIAFVELREPGPDGTFGSTTQPAISPAFRQRWTGPLILNQDYDKASAEAAVAEGRADGIAFGRPFISNPDLVERLRTGAPLAKDDMATWYSRGPEGYTDYPALAREDA